MTSRGPGIPRLSPPGVALLALVAVGGCVEFETTDAPPFEPERRAELSRDLNPPIAIASDATLGSSIATLLDDHTEGCSLTVGQMGYSCQVGHYDLSGATIAVDEHCVDAHRRLFLYEAESGSAPSLWRVIGDLDDDDRVDGWFDPSRGELLEDDNRDGRPDRRTVSGDHIDEPFVVTFDEDWEPPSHIESWILEDTDFDAFYDRETLVAGVDEDGNQTHWVAR